MKFVPHAITFTFFFMLALAAAGVFPFSTFLRVTAVTICLTFCVLIVEAFVLGKQIKPAQLPKNMTVVASQLLRKGDVCTVDTASRTVEKALS